MTKLDTRVAHCSACGSTGSQERLTHDQGCEALDAAALVPREPGFPPAGVCPHCGGAWGESHEQANACLAPGTERTGNRFVTLVVRGG